ncbi:MAG: UvrD-helicase domain-containing protein [Firmicutes bacterium]|nr:UvrD-helicase domain-containing protein [Bacillota bacterium]
MDVGGTGMQWSEKQKEAILDRGNNLLVSAAAGSGKTAVLVERIKGLLLEDNIQLTEMLIVTFSNAAAAEMRDKIAAALQK